MFGGVLVARQDVRGVVGPMALQCVADPPVDGRDLFGFHPLVVGRIDEEHAAGGRRRHRFEAGRQPTDVGRHAGPLGVVARRGNHARVEI